MVVPQPRAVAGFALASAAGLRTALASSEGLQGRDAPIDASAFDDCPIGAECDAGLLLKQLRGVPLRVAPDEEPEEGILQAIGEEAEQGPVAQEAAEEPQAQAEVDAQGPPKKARSPKSRANLTEDSSASAEWRWWDNNNQACQEYTWPDRDHGLTCGACKVLVDHFNSYYGSCHGYCTAIDRECLGAWEEVGDTCQVMYPLDCMQSIDSSDAICECSSYHVSNPNVPAPTPGGGWQGQWPSPPQGGGWQGQWPSPPQGGGWQGQWPSPPQAPAPGGGWQAGRDACNEALWPDLDHGITCGECKVLVHHFNSKYKNCHGYCNSINRWCRAAWEEVGDTCQEMYPVDCGTRIDSSDAICECSDTLRS